MRTLFLAGWLLLPVGFGIWHYGPGQDRIRLDDTAELLTQAEKAARDEKWTDAVKLYDDALKTLPKGHAKQGQRIRLEKAVAEMNAQQLPSAHADLKTLCDEVQGDETTDPKFLAKVRNTLAQSQFYITWLMRLEGMPREMWEPEIEASRQTYRLLAEQAAEEKDATQVAQHQKDLEASIRLARMDLSELQGLPLPCQCKGCKCKSPKRSNKVGKQLVKDARGASSGPPADSGGH